MKLLTRAKMHKICSSNLLVENKKVRGTQFDYRSEEETGLNLHKYDYVIAALIDCLMMLKNADGT